MSVSMSIVDYTAHNRKASNVLCTLVERENNSFQVPAKTATKERVTDLAGSLVTSSGPAIQKRRDDRTWNAGVAVRTADGSRRTADAGDESNRCLLAHVCELLRILVHLNTAQILHGMYLISLLAPMTDRPVCRVG